CECKHIYAFRSYPHACGHGAVLRDGPDEETHRCFREQEPGSYDDRNGKADDEDAVPTEDDIVDRPITAEPRRRVDLHIVRAEYQAEKLLKDERHSPSGQERFQWTAIEPANDPALERKAYQGCHEKAKRQRYNEVGVIRRASGAKAGNIDLQAEW